MFLHKQRDIDEVFKLLCCDADIKRTPREQLDTNEDIINFQNGLLNIKTWELEPHTSEELTTIQLPCDYDPSEINAPVFMQFINDLTEGDSEKADFLLQFMSICISNLKAPRFKKALFMVGKGNTGKSQLKKLIEKLLGPENYANIDLKDLEGRWGTARMYGKRLTGCNDMQFAAMPELNVFKQITGGDTIKAEFKGGQLFDFIYNGVMWFCTNKMPKFGGDKGEHVYNRIIILECNNVIPEEKQNKFLVDEMYEERSAIINILLTYLKTLQENNYILPEPSASKQAKEGYVIENNSVHRFYYDCCCQRPQDSRGNIQYDSVTTKVMYDTYVKWCRDNNNSKAVTKGTFKDELINVTGMPESELVKRTKANTYYQFTLNMATKNDYNVYDTIDMAS